MRPGQAAGECSAGLQAAPSYGPACSLPQGAEAEKTLGSAHEDPEGAAQGLPSSTPSCTATH